MKENKNFFYISLGIGIGIILTSFIFTLKPKIKYKDYSDEEIRGRAKKLGMVPIKEKIEPSREKEKEKEKAKEKKEEKVSFYIESEDTLTSVTNNLFEKKLISNKEDFIQIARDKRWIKN